MKKCEKKTLYCRAGHMKILRKRIACWITKATDTNSGYAILINFLTATMVAQTRLKCYVYTYITCPVRCFNHYY